MFLNPGNYFLIWAPNPETIYKTRAAFTNPKYWTSIAANHLKPRDCPRQVSHVLAKRERERGCQAVGAGILHSLSFYVFDFHRISHCFFFTFSICKEFQYIKMYVYTCQLIVLFDLRQSEGIT